MKDNSIPRETLQKFELAMRVGWSIPMAERDQREAMDLLLRMYRGERTAIVRCRDCKYRNADLQTCNLLSNDCTPIPWEERERLRLARPSGYEAATFDVDDDFGCVHGERA